MRINVIKLIIRTVMFIGSFVILPLAHSNLMTYVDIWCILMVAKINSTNLIFDFLGDVSEETKARKRYLKASSGSVSRYFVDAGGADRWYFYTVRGCSKIDEYTYTDSF